MNNKKQRSNVKITSVNVKNILSSMAIGALVLVPMGLYYNYEYQGELWAPAYIDEEDYTRGEDGELYYYLGPGEHTMLISRNDALPHKIEKIDGYEIRKVEVNSWRDNNQVVYVNTEPVKVRLTEENDVFSFFDEFGEVVSEEEYQKVLEKRKY